MLESMWSSMASSIQLAAECLKNEPLPMEEKEGEKANSMEGLEIFAQAIESSEFELHGSSQYLPSSRSLNNNPLQEWIYNI